MNIAPLFPFLSLTTLSEQLFRFLAASPLALVWFAGFTWDVWLRYFVALIFTVAGLVMVRKEVLQTGVGDRPRTGVLDRLVALGPLFMAMPMAVFAFDHFIEAQSIQRAVPPWMPGGQLFWTYLVGAALLCAAVSIVANRYTGLASLMLGIMFLVFEAFLHIPAVVRSPAFMHISAVVRSPQLRQPYTILFRDFSFAGGAFALAATYSQQWRTQGTHRFLWVARLMIGVPVIAFGVQSFIYPLNVPGIALVPLMPTWIPLRPVWNYAMGAVEVVTGLCLVMNLKARAAALWLGVANLVIVLVIYVPILIVNASSITKGLNFFADTLVLSGVAFLFARSQRPSGAIQAGRAAAAQQAVTESGQRQADPSPS